MAVDERRQALQAELEQIERQEREQAEQARRQEQQRQEALMSPDQRARREEIERRADEALDREYPQAWLPQKPENGHPPQIVGLVLRIDPRVGPSKAWGTYSAVIELRATDGQEWTVWANEGGALHSQMVRLRIQPGEVVALRYRGKKDSATNPGQSYHDFRLARIEDEDQPAAPVDYDALQRAQQEPPALPAPASAPVQDDDIPF